MKTCDVLVVGGGPAGSTCAWALARRGVEVVVLDKAVFPRDKLCAGWITPDVFERLEITPSDYANGRVCQPITAFRVGQVGGRSLRIDYGRPVSYAIRRSEFDHFLLDRCGARLCLGEAVRQLRRDDSGWIVNDRIAAPMLVAAGGHFCPAMRRVADNTPVSGAVCDHREPDGRDADTPTGDGNPHEGNQPVVAQEIEFLLNSHQTADCKVEPGVPELYFTPDLAGYGWCLRKGDYLNVGLGREDGRNLAGHVATFCRWLKQHGRIPQDAPTRLRGHAYYLYPHSPRFLSGKQVMAIGDAAGLAYAASGEGIGPAVESALAAAQTVFEAKGNYSIGRLQRYDQRIVERFGRRHQAATARKGFVYALRQLVAAHLLSDRWFARRVVLDRWFLHLSER